MPAWLRAWPIYGLLVAVLVGTYFVTRARREAGAADPLLPATLTLEQNIEIKFSEVTMKGRQKGVPRWIIQAPTVSLSKDGRYTYFEPRPNGRFLNLKDWSKADNSPAPSPGPSSPQALAPSPASPPPPSPVAAASATPQAPEPSASSKVHSMDWVADKARYDSFTEDLQMEGHAVLTTDDKDVIHTEKVEYRSRTKRVNMPKPVDIKMHDKTDIKADTLDADTDAEVFELKGHVDFRAKVNDEEKL